MASSASSTRVGPDVGQRAPDIRFHEAIDVDGVARIATDSQARVQKNHPGADIVEQIFHVILDEGELLDLGLQFRM